MKRFVLNVLSVFIVVSLSAQDSIQYAVGSSFQYLPNDFFLSGTIARSKRDQEHQLRFGVGVNRTFFQQRFYPQLTYQFGYYLFKKNKFVIPVFARSTASFLKFQSQNGISSWLECYLGCGFQAGKKNKFGLATGIGPSIECFRSDFNNQLVTVRTWSYFFEITWRNEIRW